MSVKPFVLLLFISWINTFSIAQAEQEHIVDHVDLITVDPQLSLADLIVQTLEKYPDYQLISAMHQESDALQERGSRWFAGAPTASVYYRDDFAGSDTGAYEVDAGVAVPVWNWGQRDAGLQLAEQSQQSITYQVQAIKLKVAGLVRIALWELKLEEWRYHMAKKAYHLTEQLTKTVDRRVELGDLPKTDFLLAQSELLQNKTELMQAEAELMHVRKRFYFLTQDNKMPAEITETQSTLEFAASHPGLMAIDATIAKKKAQMEWVKAKGSGQATIGIGGDTDKPSRVDSAVNSITFTVSVPFGGRAYIAPVIAASNKQYVAAQVAKAHMHRKLLEQMHEAEHELEVERAILANSQQMQANAYEHLQMANLSFEAGEINLMDFLRIQKRSLQAIKNAQESAIKLQRDIALYNQAVGVMP
ncbi:MAG: TolC family protein [Methyloprofundus sp.]|nr:TolC family protein [Methyloprofundus sp.]